MFELNEQLSKKILEQMNKDALVTELVYQLQYIIKESDLASESLEYQQKAITEIEQLVVLFQDNYRCCHWSRCGG